MERKAACLGSINNRSRLVQAYAFGLPRCKNYNRVGIMHNNFTEEERDFVKKCFKLPYESHTGISGSWKANFSRYLKIKDIFEAFFKGSYEEWLI